MNSVTKNDARVQIISETGIFFFFYLNIFLIFLLNSQVFHGLDILIYEQCLFFNQSQCLRS